MITIHEIKAFFGYSIDYGVLCRNIDDTVEGLFCDLLGEDLFDSMQLAVVSYSYDVWDEETTYVLNAQVTYEGLHYMRSSANETSIRTPDCSDDWTLQPKFSNACYQLLWEKYLYSLLCLMVFNESKVELHVRLKSSGFIVPDSDPNNNIDGEGANVNWFGISSKELNKKIEKKTRLMVNWIQKTHSDESSTCDFSDSDVVEDCNNDCDKIPNTGAYQIHWGKKRTIYS